MQLVSALHTLHLRIPRAIGFGAGLLALALLLFSVVGAAWGLWRPTLEGHRVEGGGYALSNPADVQFLSFITFALLTGLLGVVIGAVAYLRGERFRGVGILVWSGVVCLAGAAAFYVFGGVTATAAPEQPGEFVEFVPKFSPAIGWLVAPFMAMFAYWSAVFVNPDSELGDAPDREVNNRNAKA